MVISLDWEITWIQLGSTEVTDFSYLTWKTIQGVFFPKATYMATAGMENARFSLQKAELAHILELVRWEGAHPLGQMRDRMDPRPHSEQVGGWGEKEHISQKLLDFFRITVILLSEVDCLAHHFIFLASEFDRGSMDQDNTCPGSLLREFHCSLMLFWIFCMGTCVGVWGCDMCMSIFCVPQHECGGQEQPGGVHSHLSWRAELWNSGL